jgi:hypothetical protein
MLGVSDLGVCQELERFRCEPAVAADASLSVTSPIAAASRTLMAEKTLAVRGNENWDASRKWRARERRANSARRQIGNGYSLGQRVDREQGRWYGSRPRKGHSVTASAIWLNHNVENDFSAAVRDFAEVATCRKRHGSTPPTRSDCLALTNGHYHKRWGSMCKPAPSRLSPFGDHGP